MDETGGHQVKWNKPASERQMFSLIYTVCVYGCTQIFVHTTHINIHVCVTWKQTGHWLEGIKGPGKQKEKDNGINYPGSKNPRLTPRYTNLYFLYYKGVNSQNRNKKSNLSCVGQEPQRESEPWAGGWFFSRYPISLVLTWFNLFKITDWQRFPFKQVLVLQLWSCKDTLTYLEAKLYRDSSGG